MLKIVAFIFLLAAVFIASCKQHCDDCRFDPIAIRGQVIDSRNGQPIAGALVAEYELIDSLKIHGDTILVGPDMFTHQTLSDENGQFSLNYFFQYDYGFVFAFKPHFELWKYYTHGSSVIRNDSMIISLDTLTLVAKSPHH